MPSLCDWVCDMVPGVPGGLLSLKLYCGPGAPKTPTPPKAFSFKSVLNVTLRPRPPLAAGHFILARHPCLDLPMLSSANQPQNCHQCGLLLLHPSHSSGEEPCGPGLAEPC